MQANKLMRFTRDLEDLSDELTDEELGRCRLPQTKPVPREWVFCYYLHMPNIPPVTLSEYQSQWPQQFQEEKLTILKAIGDHVLAVEHIGSTAVPGLVSKPELDILISVEHLSNADQCVKPLEELGYGYYAHFEESVPDRKYFRKTDWNSETYQPLVHIHMVEHDSLFWFDQLAFRNYLIAHPDTAKKYGDLKRQLVEQYEGDRPSYSEKKKEFVDNVMAVVYKNHQKPTS